MTASFASAADEPRTVVVEPGERYRAGWFGRLFLGSQWRDLWTTPIRVPVLDLRLFDGGVTPQREGGGLQTKNLRLVSAKGHHWVFRGVDKDPKRVLEPEIRESLRSARPGSYQHFEPRCSAGGGPTVASSGRAPCDASGFGF